MIIKRDINIIIIMEITELETQINFIKRRSYNEIKTFLKNQLYLIQFKIPRVYKNKNYFEHLLHLSILINYVKKNITIDSPIFKLLVMINKCMHGQKILLKYNDFINTLYYMTSYSRSYTEYLGKNRCCDLKGAGPVGPVALYV